MKPKCWPLMTFYFKANLNWNLATPPQSTQAVIGHHLLPPDLHDGVRCGHEVMKLLRPPPPTTTTTTFVSVLRPLQFKLQTIKNKQQRAAESPVILPDNCANDEASHDNHKNGVLRVGVGHAKTWTDFEFGELFFLMLRNSLRSRN